MVAIGFGLYVCYKIYWLLRIFTDFLEVLTRTPDSIRPFPTPEELPESPVVEPDGLNPWVLLNLVQLAITVYLIMKPNKVYRICEHGFRVEGVRASSALVTSAAPDFLAEVWVKFSRFVPAKREGTIFRVGQYLYTAAHVLQGAERAWIKYGKKFMELDLSNPQLVDTDVRRFSYEPVSALQMGAGKFVKSFSTQIVNVHNGDSGSMGKLSLHDTVGMVEYDGSTLPSFSGSPYFLGRTIFGLHVGCGMLNVGVDGSLLNHLATNYRPEADYVTTDYQDQLANEFRKNKGAVRYRRTGNDFVVVQVGSGFITYSEEEFDAAREQYDIEARYHSYPKYKGESVSAAELAELNVSLDTKPVTQVPKKVLPKVLENIPEETPAMFTIQDSENCQWPGADATPRPGLLKASEPVSVPKPAIPSPTPIESSPLPPTPQTSLAGLKRQVAQQKFLSAITYDCLKAWLELTAALERDGINPTKAEMDVLRTLWLGQSLPKNDSV